MGSGKTTIGTFLKKKLKRTAVLSTSMIKSFVSDYERGERDYQLTASILKDLCESYLRQGINVVLVQAFWKMEFIHPYIEMAQQLGITFSLYQLEGPIPLLIERVKERVETTGDQNIVAEEAILENFKKWENGRYDLGTKIDISHFSSQEIANKIYQDLQHEPVIN